MSETTRRTKRTQSAASEDVRKEEGMTTATKSVAAKSAKGRRGRAAQKHLVYRARHTYINSTEELGALVRIFRLRTGMTQTEAAKACGVGRRWFNELENGKDTIRVGMVINVLRHFGATLTIGGAGARFTVEELENDAVMKHEGDHVWEAEFKAEYETEEEKTEESTGRIEVRKRGQKAGYISPRRKTTKNTVKFVEEE